ncbi:MAG: GNAT family N-acetyltransferase [Methylophilaceae bacterium]|nr:GNAT family N-acetyltransferase [Methylophilaceae bacterium]
MTHFKILQVDWLIHQTALKAVREQVFIIEQHVPVELEWDTADGTATHFLAINEAGVAMACVRILTDGHIGRMAVIKAFRGLGIGRTLLNQAIMFCKAQGFSVVRLSAQKQALNFYAQAGFIVCSAEYIDAGIPHCDMKLNISD